MKKYHLLKFQREIGRDDGSLKIFHYIPMTARIQIPSYRVDANFKI